MRTDTQTDTHRPHLPTDVQACMCIPARSSGLTKARLPSTYPEDALDQPQAAALCCPQTGPLPVRAVRAAGGDSPQREQHTRPDTPRYPQSQPRAAPGARWRPVHEAPSASRRTPLCCAGRPTRRAGAGTSQCRAAAAAAAAAAVAPSPPASGSFGLGPASTAPVSGSPPKETSRPVWRELN